MFSLESPHGGDSNEYIQHTIINMKKITLNYPRYNNVCSCGIFPGDSRASLYIILVFLSAIGLRMMENREVHHGMHISYKYKTVSIFL